MAVLLETSLGNLEVDLYVDEAPQLCLNFLKLCKIKFYNFNLIHKVLKGFTALTGDPSGTGNGGTSVWGTTGGDAAKLVPRDAANRIKHKRMGTLSMITDSNGMQGSQFLITLGTDLDSLDGKHSVFGEVAEDSFGVLKKINAVFVDEGSRPYQDIRIRHTIVLDDPYDDPPGLRVPESSPIPTEAQLETGRIRDDEDIDEFDGMTEEEVEDLIKKRRAQANATLLEMMGDRPDANVTAPENVLFVAQLNPVTTSEDLKIIFSRFGPVVECEVIKDKKTLESLQYAFIEFEKVEDCEEAYSRMNNVLIDDKRIVVDFSQSVSKTFRKPRGVVELGRGRGTSNLQIKGARKDDYAMVFDGEPPAQEDPRGHRRRRSRSPPRRDRDRDRDRDRGRDRPRDRPRDRDRDRERDRRGDHRGDSGRRRDDGSRHDHRDRDRDRDRDRRDHRDRRDRR